MSSAREDVLARAVERLYAGWYIYGALAYLVWLPVLALFTMVVSSEWYTGLSGSAKGAVALAYWLGAAVLLNLGLTRFWRGYLRRLKARAEARLGSGRSAGCSRVMALWLLVPPLIFAAAYAAQEVGARVGASFAFGLLVGLAFGSAVNTAAEYCYSERRPASLIAAVILGAGSPAALWWGWSYTIELITLAYSTVSIAYLVKALTRLS